MSSEKQNFQFQQSEKNRRENMNLCITRRRENAPRSNVWLSRGLRAECAQRFRRWLQKTAKFAIKAGHNWVSVLLLSVSLSFFDYKRGNWVYLRRWPVDWLAHNPLIDISAGPKLHLGYNDTFLLSRDREMIANIKWRDGGDFSFAWHTHNQFRISAVALKFSPFYLYG